MITLYYTEKTKYWPSFKQQSRSELGTNKIIMYEIKFKNKNK